MIGTAATALQARQFCHNLTQAANPPAAWAAVLVPCLEAELVVFNTAKPRDPARPLYLDGHY